MTVETMSFCFSYRRYRRAFRKALRTARGEWRFREGFILYAESQEGQVGFGEIAPIPEFGTETVDAAANFLQHLVEDPALAENSDELDGLPCCAFALSAAQRSTGNTTENHDRHYQLAGLLPAGPDALRVLQSKVAQGYSAFKWKIGVLPVEEEVALLGNLVSKLPDASKIRLDANGGLSETEFIQWLEGLDPFRKRIDYLEQPLQPGAELLMAELGQKYDFSIALDESLNGSDEAVWLNADKWPGPFVVKPLLMGDIDQLAKRLQPIASRVTLSSAFETGIGLHNALKLAEALPGLNAPVGFDTQGAFEDNLNRPSAVSGGSISLADHSHIESLWKTLRHLS
ncbi:MAG: o-succinylbenzoate synthase [Verrucomicrobiota bacterium]